MTEEQIKQKAENVYIRCFDDDFKYTGVLHALEICAEEVATEATKELRKEKADLIARIKRTRCDGIELLNIERERLTKAKEIIRELISWQILTQYWEAKAKAEAFLNKE